MGRTLKDTSYLTAAAMMVAIELIVGLVPYLGYIPLNPALNVTIVHIPVIIGAVLLGPKMGAMLGFVFGATSLINATFLRPHPIESPIFSPFFSGGAFEGGWESLVICFVPRILVGLAAGCLYLLLSRTNLNQIVSLALCGVVGSMTNTILVLGGIWVFFKEPYSAAYGMTIEGLYTAIMGIISFNGLLEAAAAAIITALVAKAVFVSRNRFKKSKQR